MDTMDACGVSHDRTLCVCVIVRYRVTAESHSIIVCVRCDELWPCGFPLRILFVNLMFVSRQCNSVTDSVAEVCVSWYRVCDCVITQVTDSQVTTIEMSCLLTPVCGVCFLDMNCAY